MGSVITGNYLGNKKVELTHELSGAKITTDAPPDNQGEGRSFSPTDLVAAALGSCIMTIIGIYADNHNLHIEKMTMRVEKNMGQQPRRIASLPVHIHLPKNIPFDERTKIEAAARACPVHKTLGDDCDAPILFRYDL